MLVTANQLDTETIKLLVIAKSKTPRCFQGVKLLKVDQEYQWAFLKTSGNVNNKAQLEDFINVDDHIAVSNFPMTLILQNLTSKKLDEGDNDDC